MKKKFLLIIAFLIGISYINVSAQNNNILEAYNFDSSTCKSGEESTCVKTNCYQDSSCDAGTIIKYSVNSNEIKYFYVLSDDKTSITMQQRENTVSEIEWHYTVLNPDNTQGPDTALAALDTATSSWTNVIKENDKIARLITYNEAVALGCNFNECPEWMYTNLESTTNGYWTNDKNPDNNTTAYSIIQGSLFYANANSKLNGIRAVIKVSRDEPQNSNENSSTDSNNSNSDINNTSSKGEVVKVENTAKTVSITGFIIGIIILALGCYVIYNSIKKEEV